MNDIKLGKLIKGGDAHRDAVHMAVAPVEASEVLAPGQHVGLNAFGHATASKAAIGVVDPFLNRPVQPKQRFYLFLYPGTVTGMRHHWSHPAFPESAVPTLEQVTAGEPGPAGSKRLSDLQYSEEWLRRYAVIMNPYIADPEAVYQALLKGLRSGELFADGTDLHGLYELEDAEELRHHAEVVLGERIDWNTFTFSCSC